MSSMELRRVVEGYYVLSLRPPENFNYSRLDHLLEGWTP